MRGPWHDMTKGDWLVALTLLGLSLAGMVLVASAPAGSRVVAIADGQTRFTAALNQYQSIDIDGPLGKSHLVIDEQGARITSSPCPRKICITMGPAKKSSDLIACVPNQILVRIDGNDSNEEAPYDLLSR